LGGGARFGASEPEVAMRIVVLTLGLAGLVFAQAGCKKDEKKSEPAEAQAPVGGAAGGEAAGAGAAGAGTDPNAAGATADPAAAGGAGSEAPTMANKMAHCPSAVPGADTKVAEEKNAVVLTVTAEGAARVGEIQKRAQHLDEVEGAPEAEIKHTGQGTGGGRSGKCPVVMTDVTLGIEKLKNGVKIRLTPKDASKVGELASTAKERIAAMDEEAENKAIKEAGHGEEMGDEEAVEQE
jgi:hypothetical protein